MSTSFKKKTSTRGRPALPNGVKPSLHNNQLLVSTGIPSLDILIGGGLAVGTLLLIEEDHYGSYSNIMQKLFLGECVACNHHLFIGSDKKNAESVLKEIPSTTNAPKPNDKHNDKNEKNDLKIAWRYQNQPKTQAPIHHTQFGHYFDLSSTLDEDRISTLNYESFNPCDYGSSKLDVDGRTHSIYQHLFTSVSNTISKYDLSTTNSTSIPSVLRISLQSLHSPLWKVTESTETYDPSLARFLIRLRALLRTSFACCMVTIPTHLFEEPSFVSRVRHCCDYVIRLESFEGSKHEHNPLYKEYHGLFHVHKIARLNCIGGQEVDTSDLAFKLKRKKFAIEKLHLPPDISETVSRSQVNTSSIKPGSPLCSATTPLNNVLDF